MRLCVIDVIDQNLKVTQMTETPSVILLHGNDEFAISEHIENYAPASATHPPRT